MCLLLMMNLQNALCQSIKTAKNHATELQEYEPSNKRIIQWIQNATMQATVGRSSASLQKLLMMNPLNALCLSIKTAKDRATELQKYEPSNNRIIQWIQNAAIQATVGRSSTRSMKTFCIRFYYCLLFFNLLLILESGLFFFQ